MESSLKDKLADFPVELAAAILKLLSPCDRVNLELALCHDPLVHTFGCNAIECYKHIHQDSTLRNNMVGNKEMEKAVGREERLGKWEEIDTGSDVDDDRMAKANTLFRVICELARSPYTLLQTCRNCLRYSEPLDMRTSDRGVLLCKNCMREYRRAKISTGKTPRWTIVRGSRR